MANSNVLKIVYVLDMLKRTDEFHPVNSAQIIAMLKREGFKEPERKAIGKYIKVLTDEMGYDIVLSENRNLGWYMRDQSFEDYELKMLVDAVAASKFLTAGNSEKLIKKIFSLTTKEGERVIKSMMVMDDTLKLVDSKFALKFDTVMRAIADHKQIQFQYQEIGRGNKKVLKKDGKVYQISPYYLGVWGQEYFVIANTCGYDNVSTYRVEMMTHVQVIKDSIRPMAEIDELKDIGSKGRTFADFIKEAVNLRSGDVKSIKISGINCLRREVMKKFGTDVMMRDVGDEHFSVYVKVSDAQGFYQWLAQYGKNMKIEAPEECIQTFKAFLTETFDQYD